MELHLRAPDLHGVDRDSFSLFKCYGVKLRLSDDSNVGPRGLWFAKYLRYVHVFFLSFGICHVLSEKPNVIKYVIELLCDFVRGNSIGK